MCVWRAVDGWQQMQVDCTTVVADGDTECQDTVNSGDLFLCACLGALLYKPGSVINCGMGQVRLGQWRLCPLFVFVLFLTISGHSLAAEERGRERVKVNVKRKKIKLKKKKTTDPPVICYLNTEKGERKFKLWPGLKFCYANEHLSFQVDSSEMLLRLNFSKCFFGLGRKCCLLRVTVDFIVHQAFYLKNVLSYDMTPLKGSFT